jgi:DNA-directed RNA polymerase subunit M/transcription elongation factor TFIIS
VPDDGGGPGLHASDGASTPLAPGAAGQAHISVVCPHCNARLHATVAEIGQTLVCPDCLESVIVPSRVRPAASGGPPTNSRPTAPAAPIELAAKTGTAHADPQGDEEELRLCDPVHVPRELILPKVLVDILAVPSATDESSPPPPQKQPAAEPRTDDQFSVKCRVCDTLLYASEGETGQQKTCPDCGSSVLIQRPPRKPKKRFDVNEKEYESDSFQLDEPAPRPVYVPSTLGSPTRTLGEQALQEAERRRREREEAENGLPGAPLWTGLFTFLADAKVLVRICAIGGILAVAAWLTLASIRWAQQGGGIWFFALLGCVGLVALAAGGGAVIFGTCLNIVQHTADGNERIADWPEFAPGDRVFESLSAWMAVFYSMTPGMILEMVLGFPGGWFWLVLGLSVYLLFPVVQLSILESGSLATPFSQEVLKSMREESLLWITYYVFTGLSVILVAACSTAAATLGAHFLVLVVLGVFWAFVLVMTYRLLGRLAWACQVRPMLRERQGVDETREE